MPNIVKVERKKWMRGRGEDNLCVLLDSATGKYDIVGKMLLDLVGFDPSALDGKRYPHELVPNRREYLPEPLKWMVSKAGYDAAPTCAIIEANDSETLTDSEREQKIYEAVYVATGGRIHCKFADVFPREPDGFEVNMCKVLDIPWAEFIRQERAVGRDAMEIRYCEEMDRRYQEIRGTSVVAPAINAPVETIDGVTLREWGYPINFTDASNATTTNWDYNPDGTVNYAVEAPARQPRIDPAILEELSWATDELHEELHEADDMDDGEDDDHDYDPDMEPL